ncbi:unnamed protein product [Cunninghamella echinulata]
MWDYLPFGCSSRYTNNWDWNSGIIYGETVRTPDTAPNPIFVGQGHRISLKTKIKMILATCQYHLPETIRRADQDY